MSTSTLEKPDTSRSSMSALVDAQMRRHRGRYLQMAIRTGLTADEAEDALQNTCLLAITTPSPCREPRAIINWLETTLKRQCNLLIMQAERHRKHICMEHPHPASNKVKDIRHDDQGRSHVLNPELLVLDSLAEQEQRQVLSAALACLSDEDRELLLRVYGRRRGEDGERLYDIAEEYQCRPDAFRQRISRLRSRVTAHTA